MICSTETGVLIASSEEYRRCSLHLLSQMNVVIVNNLIVKNRYGRTNVPYFGNGVFGFCNRCCADIKEREMFMSKYIGCMC